MSTNFTNLNVASFMGQAGELMRNKVYFDRKRAKELNAPNHMFAYARQFIGTDVDTIVPSEDQVRLYIVENFGFKALTYFETERGQIVVDHEHAVFFYYALLAQNSPLAVKALGLAYYLGGHYIDDEWAGLHKNAPKDLISPSFRLSANVFGWGRCPQIMRKYMVNMSVQNGYEGYYFERGNISQLAYLVSNGYTLADAKKQLDSLSGGLFFTFLPPNVENTLMSSLLNGNFKSSLMDGMYASNFLREKELITASLPYNDTYNVYNEKISPIKVELMGLVVSDVRKELSNNPNISGDDVVITHISQYRLGVALKHGLSLQEALPDLGKFFRKVDAFNPEHLLTGDLF